MRNANYGKPCNIMMLSNWNFATNRQHQLSPVRYWGEGNGRLAKLIELGQII